ncbi:hypothetical protein [Agrobacterium sp.]|uniref:Uncharacterized protein n=1 Tax=Agrobacterium tomkonis CFBP 6623 TaxID=1183432 RepID=A0A1S7NL56_9HYPH|nr:hypothetical protein [Agrobacterium sp.]KRA56995.1 hypothetical protein ASD85_18330 [Rhizobium sp. Root651]MCD4662455.1 hypothetical protein [Agrobacterium sp.]CUX08678.1 hypothetical protein AGR3A_Cc10138 [Agrobacterium tomkonis CFBP 6623]
MPLTIPFSPDSFFSINRLNLQVKLQEKGILHQFAIKPYCLCRQALPCVVRVTMSMMTAGHGKQMKSIRG